MGDENAKVTKDYIPPSEEAVDKRKTLSARLKPFRLIRKELESRGETVGGERQMGGPAKPPQAPPSPEMIGPLRPLPATASLTSPPLKKPPGIAGDNYFATPGGRKPKPQRPYGPAKKPPPQPWVRQNDPGKRKKRSFS